jgi:hypothetical protein
MTGAGGVVGAWVGTSVGGAVGVVVGTSVGGSVGTGGVAVIVLSSPRAATGDEPVAVISEVNTIASIKARVKPGNNLGFIRITPYFKRKI